MNFSKYQIALFNWVRIGRGDGIVNAVAGAGKSTSIREVVRIIAGTALVTAFNVHAAKELESKLTKVMTLEGIDVKTLHSLGMGSVTRAFGKCQVNEYKYRDLLGERFETREEANACLNLFDLCRASLVDCSDREAVMELAAHHAIDNVKPEMLDLLPALAKQGIQLAQVSHVIDFTDMIWLPNVLNLPVRQYDWCLVDECQDLSKAQLELVLKARGKGGRMLFVGDPRQSIYGFAGADANSFYAIKERLGATEMPLSICYRCPQEVIKLAQTIVPQIEAAPDAKEGVVRNIKDTEVAANVREGDLILCRLTAPLIKLCLELIKNRIPARVRGRDIAKNLTSIIRKVAKTNRGAFTLEALEAWSAKEVDKITGRKNHESALQTHEDKVDGIRACYEAMGKLSTNDFCDEIESLFSDGRASVMLSTVHRAKGLEEKRVFILKPERLPLTWARMADWQFEQERNLQYVAYTRAMDELIIVDTTEDH